MKTREQIDKEFKDAILAFVTLAKPKNQQEVNEIFNAFLMERLADLTYEIQMIKEGN